MPTYIPSSNSQPDITVVFAQIFKNEFGPDYFSGLAPVNPAVDGPIKVSWLLDSAYYPEEIS